MLSDVGLMAAVEMSPASYAAASERLTRYLATHDLPEFHATDLVAGRKRSAFARLSPEQRLHAFRKVSAALIEAGDSLSYVHIPRSQYESMRVDLAGQHLNPGLDWKAAIRRVTLRTLVEEALSRPEQTMIVVDQDRPQAGPKVVKGETAPGLVGGGVISAPSDQVIGLQLADMAAFCMGRHMRRRSRYPTIDRSNDEGAMEYGATPKQAHTPCEGIAGLAGFDGVVVETLAGFEARTRSLLSPVS